MSVPLKDMYTVRCWAGVIATGTLEQIRQACRENDRNGDFDEASFEACASILVGWMAELLEAAE